MSVSKWAYRQDKCDGKPCCGECDLCDHPPEDDEMTKFRLLLNENGIKWMDNSSIMIEKSLSKYNITRTVFAYKGYKWSVIHGYGTYAVNEGEPIGWLTAEEAFEYVKKGDVNEDNSKQ